MFTHYAEKDQSYENSFFIVWLNTSTLILLVYVYSLFHHLNNWLCKSREFEEDDGPIDSTISPIPASPHSVNSEPVDYSRLPPLSPLDERAGSVRPRRGSDS